MRVQSSDAISATHHSPKDGLQLHRNSNCLSRLRIKHWDDRATPVLVLLRQVEREVAFERAEQNLALKWGPLPVFTNSWRVARNQQVVSVSATEHFHAHEAWGDDHGVDAVDAHCVKRVKPGEALSA